MPGYRIYPLDQSGKIVWGRDVQCDDDDEAIRIAKDIRGPYGAAEIWQGTRYVGRATVLMEGRHPTFEQS